MPKSIDQMLGSSESTNDKRSSFSLSSGFQSVRRAVSGRGRKSDKDAEALAESLASSSLTDPPPAYALTKPEDSSQGTHNSPVTKPPSRVLSLYSRLRGPASANASEADKFRFLAEFDTVFLIDDSSSMSWNDRGSSVLRSGELSRWEQTRNAIQQIIPICMQWDQDGIDLYFLNDPYHMNFFDDPHKNEPGWTRTAIKEEGKASHAYVGISDQNDVKTVFNSRKPMLNTPTGRRLGEIMETYVDCYEAREAKRKPLPKPLNIIVITDGEASDKDVLRDNLIRQAERLDALCAPYHQLGVQFFQVGKDEWAARHLRELDDGLGKYRKGKELRDIVDCVTHEQLSGEGEQLTADIILKIVLGAVNRHLDNQRIREGLLVAPT
ncbi:hypothetical protein GQX73_g6420 [Xylaria multiplex]|uniref:VWFA domain-containing protein n=1 Tax=Xylaria multiplex TaxID=323545 RepID=A0A7C8IMR4_9PEZI|nr:hypothetical protein GQX73_g6420 [Xylaria multiplex]